ncbi:MAG: heavy-metal-associated domain-containing protein [Proteobacteria bacterium]|nr:heavy-metal-associated domain-containing protein [Pseudomonadota bacterium]
MHRVLRATAFALSVFLLPVIAFAAPAQYQLRVDGLACPFCAYGIEKELKRTDGVESIRIDINAGTVTVTMAEGATMTEAQASRIVEDAGFTLGGFEEVRAQASTRHE